MIANTPPLTDLPAYRACRPNPPRDGPSCFADSRLPPPEVIERAIDDYNAVIERVAARRGAEVATCMLGGSWRVGQRRWIGW